MHTIRGFFSSAVLLVFIGCGGGSDSPSNDTLNTAPVANAGGDQAAVTTELVTLDGSGSSDADGDQLTYLWTMASKPGGSLAALTNETTDTPTFIPDVNGTYIISLVVNDGTVESSEDNVTVEAAAIIHNGLVYGTIVSSVSGLTWLDRNLGATMKCTESRDSGSFANDAEYVSSQQNCFGDYYQWGRGTDGHEESLSPTTPVPAATITPGHGEFITNSLNPNDWVDSGVDDDGSARVAGWDICPTGYHVPSITDLLTEIISDRDNAYARLKLPSAGYRNHLDGVIDLQGDRGVVWSSSPDGTLLTQGLFFILDNAFESYQRRARGFSVRCLKD